MILLPKFFFSFFSYSHNLPLLSLHKHKRKQNSPKGMEKKNIHIHFKSSILFYFFAYNQNEMANKNEKKVNPAFSLHQQYIQNQYWNSGKKKKVNEKKANHFFSFPPSIENTHTHTQNILGTNNNYRVYRIRIETRIQFKYIELNIRNGIRIRWFHKLYSHIHIIFYIIKMDSSSINGITIMVVFLL